MPLKVISKSHKFPSEAAPERISNKSIAFGGQQKVQFSGELPL